MQTKKLYFLLITLCVMNSSKVFSQAPDIQWEKTFGGSKDDELRVVRQTADGGYFIGGTSESPASGDKTQNAWADSDDFWILKTNSSGAIEWQHTIGGNSIDDFKSVEQTADGGYLLAGRSQSKVSGDKTVDTKGGADNWIMKLNSSGIIEWQQSIGSKDTDATTAMQQTSDGGYIIGSSSYGPDSKDKTEECFGGYDYWIIKLDNAGGIEWDNTIGGTLNDNLAAIEQTSDGGYILGGVSYSPLSVDKTEASVGGADYWIVKLDASGNIEWQNTIGGTGNDYLYTTQQTADGGYIIGGESLSGISGDKTELGLDQDYWVLKLTAAGAIEWQNTIGASGDDSFRDIWQTADGN
ncbi:MAG TPA: hypothetical protein PLD84_15395, partial [Chitinophagales bacterium]|nr:hypothetical protein [Chitinophagales bacterium]